MKFVTIDGESWRVLADVCDVLGHSNPSMAVRTLDNDEHDALSITDPIGLEDLGPSFPPDME